MMTPKQERWDRAHFEGNEPRYVVFGGGPAVEVGTVECDGKTARYVDSPEGRLWWTGSMFTDDPSKALWQ